jgi:hypothetical protein
MSELLGMASMAAVRTALPRAGLGSQRPVIPSGTDARKILSPIVTTKSSHTLLPLPKNPDLLIPARYLPSYIGVSARELARLRGLGAGPAYIPSIHSV